MKETTDLLAPDRRAVAQNQPDNNRVKVMFRLLKSRWMMTFALMTACVEPIVFDAPPAQSLYVIEGMISTDPGPYTVTIRKGISLNADSSSSLPVESAHVTLFDDEGNTESLIETTPGKYTSQGEIQGQLGHSYHIRAITNDGTTFESVPDKLHEGGAIQDIRYEFEHRTVQETYGEVSRDVFRIFVDATAGNAEERYTRWRFTGTYQIDARPEEHMIHVPPYTPYRSPLPCSGYILVPGPGGGVLEKVGDCQCCQCWVKVFDGTPALSDTQLINGNEFKNVKVTEVDVNAITFNAKYLVEVEQMSMSKSAFDFFKLIRTQKRDATNIFQTPSAEILGNIKAINSSDQVVGLFWATTIDRKYTFIERDAVPYPVTPIEFIASDCRTFIANSSNAKPDLWP